MTSRTANLCLAVAVVFVGWYFVLPEGVAQAVLFDLIGLVAALAILVGVRLHRPREKLPWYLFSAGLAFTLAGDIAWDVYDLGLGVDPFPSAADALYLAAYPCFLVGLVLITRRLGTGQSSAALMDALIVTAGVAVPTWVFVIDPHAHEVGSTFFERSILVLYPVLDLMLLAVLARLLFVPGARTPAYRALVIAVGCLLAADLVYAAVSSTYDAGQWLDAVWLLSHLFWAAAALYPSMARLTEPVAEREARLTIPKIVLLAAACGLAPGVLLVQELRGQPIDGIAIAVGGAILSLLVLLRMTGLVRQVQLLRIHEREADQRVRDVVRDLDAVVWEAAGDARRFSFVAGRAEELLGYAAERWLAEDDFWETLVHVEDRARVGALRRRALARSKDYTAEYRAVRADGSMLWVRDLVHVRATGQGPLLRGLMIDVTERRRVDAERERLLAAERDAHSEAEQARRELAGQNERLLELDRLKDEFVALVSHELRSPLTSIRGYLELVLDGHAGEVTPEQRHFLEVVERGSDRLLHLVGDLLFVAQVQAGAFALDLQNVDLGELAVHAVEAAQPTAEGKEIDLVASVNGVPPIRGDRARLAQLIDNLLSNALKFTPEGGRVEVVVTDDRDAALVEVRDSGIGIPASEQSRLFERFFRSSAAMRGAIPGTGLGLGIAKAIVDAHDGDIELESEEGVGTTFRVHLPSHDSRHPSQPREQAVA